MSSDFLLRAADGLSHESCLPGICTWDMNEGLLSFLIFACWIRLATNVSSKACILFIHSHKILGTEDTEEAVLCVLTFALKWWFGRERKKWDINVCYITWSKNKTCIPGLFLKTTKWWAIELKLTVSHTLREIYLFWI